MKKVIAPKAKVTVVNGQPQPIDSFKATRKNRNLRVVTVNDNKHHHEVSFLKNDNHLVIVVDNQIVWTEADDFRII